MASGFYKWYLKSEHWKTFRLYALEEHGKICKDCGATDTSLHVHHLTYANIWEEALEDVVILCHSCHWARHPEKLRLRCTHENLSKVSWESGGDVTFYWACEDCHGFLRPREPNEKEKVHAEKVAKKYDKWLTGETNKRLMKESRRKEKETIEKAKPKSKKKSKKRKTYKKQTKLVI